MKYALLLLMLILQLQHTCAAQQTISGTVKDAHSGEPIPFVSVQLKGTVKGTTTDTTGQFTLLLYPAATDTLLFTRVGFASQALPIYTTTVVEMERTNIEKEVLVQVKIDKGLWLWKKVVQRKPYNDGYRRYSNFSYELYNKLEADITHFKSIQRLAAIKPFKPIESLINKNIDTAEGMKIIPAYFTESLSDYYYQKKPLKRREEIKAVNTNGIHNESLVKFLGGMHQVIHVYDNFIPLFNKEFISPFSDNGDFYYQYFVADTQAIGADRYYQLIFKPRRKGMHTFMGDCWIHAGSFAIKTINLYLDKTADINFMEKLSYVQEYKKINDTSWFINKEKLVVTIAPMGNQTPGIIGHKTTTYGNIVVNDSNVAYKLAQNAIQEEVITMADAAEKHRQYWDTARHEPLRSTEKNIIVMIDTLMHTPSYQRITNQVVLLATGYMDIGNVQIGSVYSWFSGNKWEGFRTRFDIASNKNFHKKLRWHTYLAYGFGDKKLKGKAALLYLPKKDPRQYWYIDYSNDLDFGQRYYGEIANDNLFSFAVRKQGIPIKFIQLQQYGFEFFNEWRCGFSTAWSVQNKAYTPLLHLVPAAAFEQGLKNFTTTELSLRLRFAWQEKFIASHFYRTSLGSPFPIVEATITKGVPGLLCSRYNYTKLQAAISDKIKIPPLGSIAFQLYAGQTMGTLPYPFLDVAPGNELYYYNKYAFNMMNRYQFIHDRYAGLQYEHIIGNGIFMLVPRWKLRQFYTLKALWGSLSAANKELNFKEGHPFQSLDGKTYLEVGTGVDNILRFFRIDFVWRLLPQSGFNTVADRLGVFGSVRLNL